MSFASDFWKASMGNIGQPLLDHLSDHGYKNCIGHGAQFTGDPESQLFARPGKHPASSMNVEAIFSSQIDSVSMVSQRSGQLEQVELTGRHASLELPPGGGTLLRLAKQSLSGR